jgi:hypothetical protein
MHSSASPIAIVSEHSRHLPDQSPECHRFGPRPCLKPVAVSLSLFLTFASVTWLFRTSSAGCDRHFGVRKYGLRMIICSRQRTTITSEGISKWISAIRSGHAHRRRVIHAHNTLYSRAALYSRDQRWKQPAAQNIRFWAWVQRKMINSVSDQNERLARMSRE